MNQKIFLFGCWNKNQCLEGAEHDPREEVFQLLADEHKEYDFGILLGDNIYPHKIKSKKRTKRKLTLKKFLESNVRKYRDIKKITDQITNDKYPKNLHVILGNHDVEKKCVKQNQIRHFSSGNSSIYPKNTIFETDSAVFLFLNTNNIGELLDFLHTFNPDMMNDRWLILCGHDPIYSYKPKIKKKKGKTKVRLFQKIDELKYIFGALSDINYTKMAYVCADTHNYQLIEVGYLSEEYQLAFPVIVIGTGGAKPDPLDNVEKNKTHFDDDTELHVDIIDSENPYGFVEMDISGNSLDVNYKKCGSTNKATIFYNKKKDEIIYTIDREESECELPKPSCQLDNSEPYNIEVC